ncbi:hypothetical protein chiPu_0018641 [Chiloscyllium punctatum]|uniref:Uncharacterized protein n=1 Tax=Chiloscyllium punctatum TaxID=137246 RepID=A0A401RP88_CHIPU|nr:hypothetical protein [Chiloscyllium punctatum]
MRRDAIWLGREDGAGEVEGKLHARFEETSEPEREAGFATFEPAARAISALRSGPTAATSVGARRASKRNVTCAHQDIFYMRSVVTIVQLTEETQGHMCRGEGRS